MEKRKQVTVKPEVSKILTVSTAHVTQETYERLMTDEGQSETGLSTYVKRDPGSGMDYGLYVYLTQDESSDQISEIPDDLLPLIRLAESLGCEIICLDADGPKITGYSVFSWRI